MTLRFQNGPARRLLEALFQDGDWVHLVAYTEAGVDYGADHWVAERLQTKDKVFVHVKRHPKYRAGFDGPGFTFIRSVPDQILEQARYWNTQRFAVAVALGVYGLRQERDGKNARALSALGIDIDPKNFEALVPGATTIEEVIPKVMEVLRARGLRPHALVSSGSGVHVYFLIERMTLTTEEERHLVQDIWYRLGTLLGGSTDRHDLASVLRLPGSVNWKGGKAKQVTFIDDYTDLSLPRFSFEAIAQAVADIPALREEGARSMGDALADPDDLKDIPAEHSAEDQQLLALMMELDRKRGEHQGLLKLQQATRDPKTKNCKGEVGKGHSEADFAYACRLLEIGAPKSLVLTELMNGMKARESTCPEDYCLRTFRAAVQKVQNTIFRGENSIWRTCSSPNQALYTTSKTPPHSNLPPPCGASTARPTSVQVVLVRAGDGKTRGVVDILSRREWSKGRRTAITAPFVRELLHHEYAINALYPGGRQYEGAEGVTVVNEEAPTSSHAKVHAELPPAVRDNWQLGRFRREVASPGAFLINAWHPTCADQRLEPRYDNSGELCLPATVSSLEEFKTRGPAAVVKFSAQPGLCLAGHDSKVLRSPARPCSTSCPHTSCRSNTTRNPGAEDRGAKTYWRDAGFPLLTHSSLYLQSLFAPKNNEFDTLIADELPPWVFRYPKLTVTFAPNHRGKEGWDVEPLDLITRELSSLGRTKATDPLPAEQRTALAAVAKKLLKFREDLLGIARLRRGELKKGGAGRRSTKRAVPFEWKAATKSPVLTADEFKLLLSVTKHHVVVEDEDDDGEGALGNWSAALLLLRDFCGDEPEINVLLQHSFGTDGHGKMRVYRPVDAWETLLSNPSGARRDLVLLDATAGMDPRYQLRGQFELEQMPSGHFPNTTVVLTESATKTKVQKQKPFDIATAVHDAVKPCSNDISKLLVVTDQDTETKLKPYLQDMAGKDGFPATVAVGHFGALRGRNDFDDFDAIYFTQPHRYDEAYYVSLGLLLTGFEGFPRQWESKNIWDKFPTVTARAMACDLYQDAMRIGIRRDPSRRAFIFVPSDRPELVVRLMRCLPGTTLRRADGTG